MLEAGLNATLRSMIPVSLPIATIIARNAVRRQFVTRVRAR